MRGDAEKVKKIKDQLNKGLKKEEWDDVIGLFMMPNVIHDLTKEGFSVNPASGAIVKCFVNLKTGEFKTYHFSIIEEKQDGQIS